MKKIYICSRLKATPFRTMQQHIEDAASYCRMAWEEGYTPIAPHIYFPSFMNDNDPAERERACAAGLKELRSCDELWLFASQGISEGMEAELKAAEDMLIPIYAITSNGTRIRQYTDLELLCTARCELCGDILQNHTKGTLILCESCDTVIADIFCKKEGEEA